MPARRFPLFAFFVLFLAACSAGDDAGPAGGDAKPTVTAKDLEVTVLEDQTVEVALEVTASEGTPEVTITGQPAHGKLEGAGLIYKYTPEADYSGSDTVKFSAKAGAAEASGTVVITVKPVNDAPAFTKGANVSVGEDSGAYSAVWAAGATAGPEDEAGQTLTFTVTSSNAALFAAAPAIDDAGKLTFTPAANANGSATVTVNVEDDGGTADGGVETGTEATFTITVVAVNDAPSFTKGADQSVLEDVGAQTVAGWATAVAAGPADEVAQTYAFTVTTDNAALFAVAPAISTAGALTYTPAADASGTANVYVRLADNGGAANGGADTSAVQVFAIVLTAINDAPSYTPGTNVTALEDSGAYSATWATAVSKGPLSEAAQTVTFSVSASPTNLFAVQPAIAGNGNLTFTPAANMNGSATITVRAWDDGGTANGGVNSTGTTSFTITLSSVNDAPTYTAGTNVAVNEDSSAYSASWATAIVSGPADESGQAVTFSVSASPTSLFSVQPAIGGTGTLTFTPAANANGAATVTVRAWDNGGTANGGVRGSAPVDFTITIDAVNDAPSFTAGSNLTRFEDSAAYSAGWATLVSKGPGDEASQSVTFSVTTPQSALFSAGPAIDGNGTLTFTPAANANGVATVTVRAWDDGGTARGGVHYSGSSSFTITLTAVNDAPVFTGGASLDVDEDSGAYAAAWATGISGGPTADESAQSVTFSASTPQAAFFSAAPAVATDGTLTFTPAANQYGVATVTVRAWDNGGTANGGIRVSGTVNFSITLNAVNDAPSFVAGSNLTVNEDSSAYSAAWATSIQKGPNETAQTVTFSVSASPSNLFAVQPAMAGDGTLTFTPAANANGSATLTVRAWDDGGSALGGVNYSGEQAFTITLTAVNDAPSFVSGGNVTVLEDSGAYLSGWGTGISAGPSDEWPAAQTVTFSVSASPSNLFAVQPYVNSPAGMLGFTPAANANGSATITVRAWDDGGTANGGVNFSGAVSFTITLTPVNDAPAFAKGAGQNVFEDSGTTTVPGWATGITAGPADESSQSVTTYAVTDNPGLFASAPTVALDGTLRYTLAADMYGVANVTLRLVDDGGTVNGGVSVSAGQTFIIYVVGKNDAPSFTAGTNVSTSEDAGTQTVTGWASAISPGPLNEAWQTVSFQVTTSTPGLFDGPVEVTSDGTLKYTPFENANGTATVYVSAQDNGGTAGGGVNTAAQQSFTIDIAAVNDAPSFTAGPDKYVLDTAGAQSFTSWATGLVPGPFDESGQTYSFTVTNDANTLFTVQPDLSLTGTLTFTPAATQSGTANVWVSMADDLGATVKKAFRITVDATNDAPSFTSGADVTVLEDADTYDAPWAVDITAGLGESGQALDFQITANSNPGLFDVLPAIDAAGVLTFKPAPDANGTAALTVVLHDDGGTAGGGSDTSAPVTLNINVTAVNDAPSFTDGGVQWVSEDAPAASVAGFATVTAKGGSDEAAQTVTYAVLSVDQPGLFAVQPAIDASGTLTYTLAADRNGVAKVTVAAFDDGGTANGGRNASDARTFSIEVTPVNDPPAAVQSVTSINIDEDDPLGLGQSGVQVLSSLTPGPADEVFQYFYGWNVTSSNPSLVGCAFLDNEWKLHFCTGWGPGGTVTLYIEIQDSGGTDNGGVDTTLLTVDVTVTPVPDAPVASDDFVSTSVDNPTTIWPLNNDRDDDGDPFSLFSAGTPTQGTVQIFGNNIEYTPDPGYMGPDSFAYTISDGTLYSSATVHVWVGPDTIAPAFVAAASHPVDGDVINRAETGPQLNPAVFEWDDPYLDRSGITVTVTIDGLPLVENTHFWIDYGAPTQLNVRIDPNMSLPDGGVALEYFLENVRDTYNNAGADVNVGVWWDPVAPRAEMQMNTGPNRLVALFTEEMDPASAATLVYGAPALGLTAVPDEVNGEGWFAMNVTNDSYFLVAAQPFPSGATVEVSIAGFTDLAGNPAEGPTQMSMGGNGCCMNGPGGIQIVEIRFVDKDTGATTYAVPGSAVTDGWFRGPRALVGTADFIEVQFNASLDPSDMRANLRGNQMSPTSLQTDAEIASTSLPDDTLFFDPRRNDPEAVYESDEYYRLQLSVRTKPSGPNGNYQWFNGEGVSFVLQGSPADVTAPAMYLGGAMRGSGATPTIRPEEPILLVFSEVIEPADIVAANFSLTGPAGTLPVAIDNKGDAHSIELRASDGAGNFVPLQPGAYTLQVGALRDASVNANAAAPQSFPVLVAALGGTPPALLRFATPGTNVTTPLVFSFSDRMSPGSFTDYGPASQRTLVLEEKFGATWIPLKGLTAGREGSMWPQAVVQLDFLGWGGMPQDKEMRLKFTAVKNIDGVAAAATEWIYFRTGKWDWNQRPRLNPRIDVQDFYPGAMNLGGVPVASRFMLEAADNFLPGADASALTLTTPLGEEATGFVMGSKTIELYDAQFDALFTAGLNTFSVSLTDTAGRDASVLMQLYRPAQATLVDAQPVITLPGVNGPGTFSMTGLINSAADAAYVDMMGAFIAVVDTSFYPPMVIDLEGIVFLKMIRNADGSLAYEYHSPADHKLPPLALPYSYMAAPLLGIPFPITMEGGEVMAFGVPSAPFNP